MNDNDSTAIDERQTMRQRFRNDDNNRQRHDETDQTVCVGERRLDRCAAEHAYVGLQRLHAKQSPTRTRHD
jgi:hypothetical protein